MLQTVKAEVRVDGTVRLLEPLHVTQTSPAIVTLLGTENGTIPPQRECSGRVAISAEKPPS